MYYWFFYVCLKANFEISVTHVCYMSYMSYVSYKRFFVNPLKIASSQKMDSKNHLNLF